jgi:hypothetical protein
MICIHTVSLTTLLFGKWTPCQHICHVISIPLVKSNLMFVNILGTQKHREHPQTFGQVKVFGPGKFRLRRGQVNSFWNVFKNSIKFQRF